MQNSNPLNDKDWTRRNFLKASGGCSALTSATFLSTLVNLQLTKSAVAAAGDTSGYKALVCLFQHGGNDSFNMLAPYEGQEYADYQAIRTGLALSNSAGEDGEMDPISDPRSGRQFGVHRAMSEVRDLYNEGNLAFLANVGSLIGPTSMDEYRARTNLPVGLFSHSDEQRHWQTCVPQSRTQITGWAGRMADMMTDTVNSNAKVSMNISVGLVNILQAGENVVPYVINRTQGAQVLHGYNEGGVYNNILTQATDSLLSETFTDLLEQAHATRRRNSIDAASEFNAAINSITLNTVFPSTSLGQQLEMTAKTIAARQALGQNRQIFLVERGGWDHHSNLKNNQSNMLPEVSQALKAFFDATVELQCQNEVTTFTISDFARTLTQNGSNGSDHAWGSNVCIMGGSVNGGNVWGDYPLSLNPAVNNIDVGRGRLIPTTAVDQYAAEMARWFGVSDTDLPTILPNLGNFDGTPLGIL